MPFPSSTKKDTHILNSDREGKTVKKGDSDYLGRSHQRIWINTTFSTKQHVWKPHDTRRPSPHLIRQHHLLCRLTILSSDPPTAEIQQRDPLSSVIFNLAIEKIIRTLNANDITETLINGKSSLDNASKLGYSHIRALSECKQESYLGTQLGSWLSFQPTTSLSLKLDECWRLQLGSLAKAGGVKKHAASIIFLPPSIREVREKVPLRPGRHLQRFPSQGSFCPHVRKHCFFLRKSLRGNTLSYLSYRRGGHLDPGQSTATPRQQRSERQRSGYGSTGRNHKNGIREKWSPLSNSRQRVLGKFHGKKNL